jgi:uncharacterized protein YcfJ
MKIAKASRMVAVTLGAVATAGLFTGCASTYGNLVSGSQLGAAEYRPAVFVPPGKEGQYEQVLGICRQAATNRQITAAQQAQLATITGSVKGAVDGAAFGVQFGNIFKQAGFDTSLNRSAGIGAMTGLATSLAGAFSSGTQSSASKTREALLYCLRSQQAAVGYRVVE